MAANPSSAPEEIPAPSEERARYLHQLGDRVREARARRGMTRKILARDSQVSERYLAQLEAGQGNISILAQNLEARRIVAGMGLAQRRRIGLRLRRGGDA